MIVKVSRFFCRLCEKMIDMNDKLSSIEEAALVLFMLER
jgi:hypothetical protein